MRLEMRTSERARAAWYQERRDIRVRVVRGSVCDADND